MSDKTKNSSHNNKDKSKSQTQTCPVCGGSGKIYLKCDDDDTDIFGSAVNEIVCPLCHGRGKLRHYHLRHMRIRLRPRPSRMLLRRRRASSGRGRGGKYSRSPVLLPPGTPVSSWSWPDIPKSTPESAYVGEDINYDIADTEVPKDEYSRETILKIAPNITITVGREFASNLAVDPDFTEINFREALELGSDPVSAQIVYGTRSNGLWEMFSRWIDPFNQPAVIQLEDELYAVTGNKGQLLDLEPYEAHIETHVSEYDVGAPVAIENEPAAPLTLQPHRPNSATSTDVLGPAMSGQINPLDVTGIQDPAGFDISTDVTGNVGF